MAAKEIKFDEAIFKKRLREFPAIFHGINYDFVCRYCDVRVNYKRKDNVIRHLQSERHKRTLQKVQNERQMEVDEISPRNCISRVPRNEDQKTFNFELAEMLVGANIPLHKLDNPFLRKFLEKYTHFEIPRETTIRTEYMPRLYDETLQKIREKVADNYVWVSIDETTDCCGRYMAHVIIGILDDNQSQECYLLMSEMLHKTKNETIADLFNDSLQQMLHL